MSWTTASAVPCSYRSIDVGRGLAALAMVCAHHSALFEIDFRALPLSYPQCLADIIRGLPASFVVYIFLSDASRGLLASVGLLHIALSLLGVDGPHRPMLANSVRRHYAFPSPIAFGMYNIQSTSGVAFPH